MRDAINTFWHTVAKAVQKRVPYSEEEKVEARTKAEEIRKQIADWKVEGATPIGMGQNCCTSWYLKQSENKLASYPFDWIVTSPEIIIDILDDDFNRMLDRNQIISKAYRAGHKYYHDILFGHRNPALSKDDYEYFQRCVQRWKVLMNQNPPIVFVTIVLNEVEKRKAVLNGFNGKMKAPRNQKLGDFTEMMERLNQVNPNAQFLFIEQYSASEFELDIRHQTPEVLWLRFSVKGSNTGVQYLNALDDELTTTIFKGLN
jgi:hypothetical protein